MYLLLTFFLLLIGSIISFKIGKNKINNKYKEIYMFYLSMIGVFIGVFLAIYLTENINNSQEREKTIKLLNISKDDFISYSQRLERIHLIVKLNNNENNISQKYTIDDFIEQNPQKLPTLLKTLLNNDFF